MKKRLWIIFPYFITGLVMQAQRHEIGAFLGGSNLIGDIGSSNYIAPKNPTFGILYRYNLNPRYSIRFHLMGAGIRAIDQEATEKYRKNRKLSVENHIGEISVLFEFNFFDFNDTHKTQSTPFIFSGVGLFGYQDKVYVLPYHERRDINKISINPISHVDFEKIEASKNTISLSYMIPFGIGYKYKFLYNWVITAEIGIRATDTENIDHNAPKMPYSKRKGLSRDLHQIEIEKQIRDFINRKTFGNTRSKDWYVFSGLSLTHTFGRPPCYCD